MDNAISFARGAWPLLFSVGALLSIIAFLQVRKRLILASHERAFRVWYTTRLDTTQIVVDESQARRMYRAYLDNKTIVDLQTKESVEVVKWNQ